MTTNIYELLRSRLPLQWLARDRAALRMLFIWQLLVRCRYLMQKAGDIIPDLVQIS